MEKKYRKDYKNVMLNIHKVKDAELIRKIGKHPLKNIREWSKTVQ